MKDDLYDVLERVHDRASFLAFVEALIEDRVSHDEEWQNGTIEGYLESALACLVDNEGRNDFLGEPSWRGFAEFLHGGKIYE